MKKVEDQGKEVEQEREGKEIDGEKLFQYKSQ